MVAGLEEISAGTVAIDGRVVNGVEPKDRDIAMVFQNYALYPHMSVFDNMAYGLKIAKVPVPEIKTRVDKAAQILELGPLLKRKPRELSGGQRQRVAMGRAIVRQPQVFLFDEPLSNLDAKLRAQTRIEIQKLHRELGITSLFVTHDQVEAMTLAQRIIVMNAGVMDQFATPEEVYNRPATTFVASFMGSPPMNLLHHAPGVRPGQILGIRPEHLALDESGWTVQVESVELLGAERLVYGRIGEEQIIMRTDESDHPPVAGDTVKIAARSDKLHWFDAGSGKRAS
jgi:sn-glycerol 3-phosphate transport system ATP-binding protein